MIFIKNINEYNNSKYADYYYLVLRSKYNDKPISETLKDKKIDGITSISDNEKIIDSFFDIRPLMLLLPKENTNNCNNLTKIIYTDINMLCDNSFYILRRLYDVDDTYPLDDLLYQAYQRLNRPKIKNKIVINMRNHINKSPQLHQILILVNKIKHGDDIELNNFSELVDYFYEKIKNSDIEYIFKNHFMKPIVDTDIFINNFNIKQVEYVLKYIIINFACLFENEGEVIINDSILNIPDGTIAIVKHARHYDTNLNIDLLKNIFGDKYVISVNNHKEAYIKIRNLDKIIS